MALIKWGALVVDGRGKIGGTVASKNRTGNYLRNKVTPVNPRTSFQQTARQQLGALSAQWRALTEPERDAWRGAVSQYEKTNIFGDKVQPTGKNLFVGLNRNLANIGALAITEPQTPVEFPTISMLFDNLDPDTFVMDMNPNSIPATYSMLFFATPPLSAGKDFAESEFRMIGVNTSGATTGQYDIYTQYVARFGLPVVGQKIFVRAVLVSVSTGQKGVPVQGSAIVSEAGV